MGASAPAFWPRLRGLTRAGFARRPDLAQPSGPWVMAPPVRRFYDRTPEASASAAPMIFGELDRGLVQQNGIGIRNGFAFRVAKHAEISFPRSIRAVLGVGLAR
jgi:hypothetical protein